MRSLVHLVVSVAVVTSALVGATAHADSFYSGNRLLEKCQADESDVAWGLCTGYIVGISDVLGADNAVNGYRACQPHDGITSQFRDVVVKWLEANPQKRHFAATGLVAEALSKAFPCR